MFNVSELCPSVKRVNFLYLGAISSSPRFLKIILNSKISLVILACHVLLYVRATFKQLPHTNLLTLKRRAFLGCQKLDYGSCMFQCYSRACF